VGERQQSAGDFGWRLTQLRNHRGYTQEDLAARSGISVRAIRELERGRVVKPRLSSVGLLADSLGLTDTELEAFIAAARTDPLVDDRPRRLPADPLVLVGRGVELSTLDSHIRRAQIEQLFRPVIIFGPPGVGKTALALRLAHTVSDAFPDGLLYADLRNLPGEGVIAVLRRFLADLGAGPPGHGDVSALAARFRDIAGTRRVLVVLDNATEEEQVNPLLPHGLRCTAVVTSRQPLTGVTGAEAMALRVLDAASARELFAAFVGGRRAREQPDAVDAVLAACGGLPLAIRIAAGRLRARPRWTCRDLARRLADQSRRLDELSDGTVAVRASIALSYQLLSRPAKTVLAAMAAMDPFG
jgi:transcriptional regulator with XRE-family HTH domain